MSLSNFWHIITSDLTAFSFVPAAVLCYLPMGNQLWFSPKKIVRDCVILYVVFFFGLSWLTWHYPSVNGTIFMLPFLAVAFIYYLFSVKAMPAQCAAVFMSTMTLCAVATMFAVLVNALLHPEGSVDNSGYLLDVLQLLTIIFIVLIMAPAYRNVGMYLVDQLRIPWIWILTIPFSLIIFFTLVAVVPEQNSMLADPYVRFVYLAVTLGLSAIYTIITLFFARLCNSFIREEKLRTRIAVSRIQRKQYQDMNTFLDTMHVFRHDTRHMLRTIGELARVGDNEKILDYLEQKNLELPELPVQSYCNSTIINALLNYYIQEMQNSHIITEVRVDMPKLTEHQEIDLSGLFGNMLENILLACREIPEEERRMALTVQTVGQKHLYIVATNSFNGVVRKRHGEYQSTRTRMGGSGIGIISMQRIVERYRGIMKVYHEDRTFFVDIEMRIAKEPVKAERKATQKV